MRPSYLYNGNPYIGKTTSLYRDGTLINVWVTAYPWWHHQMETFSALLALCAGNSQVTGEFPSQRPVTRSFDVFFDLCLNKRLSKQSWGWWFEKPLRSLWRHCNARPVHWHHLPTGFECSARITNGPISPCKCHDVPEMSQNQTGLVRSRLSSVMSWHIDLDAIS